MSLTPTLTAPPIDRQIDGLPAETREAGCCTYPGQFAKPTRRPELPQAPRRTVRSLGGLLHRLGRAVPRDSAKIASAPAAPAANRHTAPETGRPNLINSPLPSDELDPLPFVDSGESWQAGRQSEKPQEQGTGEGEWCSRQPLCAVASYSYPGGASNAIAAEHSATNGQSVQCECRLLDVSMTGIAVHSPCMLERGSVLVLEIRAATARRTIETRGTVVRCEPTKGQGYQVVCRLERYFQFAEIHAIGQDLFANAIV